MHGAALCHIAFIVFAEDSRKGSAMTNMHQRIFCENAYRCVNVISHSHSARCCEVTITPRKCCMVMMTVFDDLLSDSPPFIAWVVKNEVYIRRQHFRPFFAACYKFYSVQTKYYQVRHYVTLRWCLFCEIVKNA